LIAADLSFLYGPVRQMFVRVTNAALLRTGGNMLIYDRDRRWPAVF
jgi:hypothetical protein